MYFTGKMEVEKLIWVIYIRFDYIDRVIAASTWSVFVVTTVLAIVTRQKKIGPRKGKVGEMSLILSPKVFDVSITTVNGTFTVGASTILHFLETIPNLALIERRTYPPMYAADSCRMQDMPVLLQRACLICA